MLNITTLFIRKLNLFIGAAALVTLGLTTACDPVSDDDRIEREGEGECIECDEDDADEEPAEDNDEEGDEEPAEDNDGDGDEEPPEGGDEGGEEPPEGGDEPGEGE